MNNLKEMRIRFGFTQKDLANHLMTTQQTIARWESGKAAIPISQLKDLAVFFGCSVDELLGVEIHPRHRSRAGFARDEQGPLFGTLKLKGPTGERTFPIDEPCAERIMDAIGLDFELSGVAPWLEVGAMNNKLIFINSDYITDIELISDDNVAAPFFASSEVYQALTVETPVHQLGELTASERQRAIEVLLSKRGVADDYAYREDKISAEMHEVVVTMFDGTVSRHLLTDDVATEILVLSSNLADIGRNVFLKVHGEGPDCHLINLSKTALIEVPIEAYLALIDDEEE